MPNACVVGCCPHARRGPKTGVRFHAIPREPEFRQRWLAAISHKKWKSGVVPSQIRFCERHFTPEDYECNLEVLQSASGTTRYARLRKDAVPSLFLHAETCTNSTAEECRQTQEADQPGPSSVQYGREVPAMPCSRGIQAVVAVASAKVQATSTRSTGTQTALKPKILVTCSTQTDNVPSRSPIGAPHASPARPTPPPALQCPASSIS